MKLCRFGPPSQERPGLIDEHGVLRDLSSVVTRLSPAELDDGVIGRLREVDPNGLPVVPGNPRLGVPFEGTSKIVCIGLNYIDHAHETGMAIPSEPIVFLKPTTAITEPSGVIVKPPHSTQLDWEVELGVVIGKTARHVGVTEALSHVAGYCVVNDVSERAFQLQSSQWDKGKGCDTFAPLGPWLVTRDEVPDPQALDLWLDVNGSRMQQGNTRTMIFDVTTLVSYCSRYMTLLPGDVIATGTPPGVGMGKKPQPVWLEVGDTVALGISGLGTQQQNVVARSGSQE